jgi:hypothetical protein
MRLTILFFLLISSTVSAQIELKIDSITYIDSIPNERKFTINYHIENLTDKELTFIQSPNHFVSNSTASLSRKIIYKIFQNNELIDIENIFNNKKHKLYQEKLRNARSEKEKRSITDKHIEEIKPNLLPDLQKLKEDKNFLLKKQSQIIMSDILILKPKQKLSYTNELIWDKIRYLKFGDNEYYIDEKTPHYFELSINLSIDEYKNKLTPEDLQILNSYPNLSKGLFTSNKIEINFKE